MEILEPSLVERIIDEALSVLENTGVLVEHDEAFERLVNLGFTGNEETRRITFPRKIVEEALEAAPSSLTLYDRDGNPHATLEGDKVHFVPRPRRFAFSIVRREKFDSLTRPTSSTT